MKQKIIQYETVLLIVFAAFLSGGIGTFSKLALNSVPPISFLLLRFLLALLVLLPFVWKDLKNIDVKNIWKLTLVSLFAVTNFTLYIFGVARTTATISQALYAATPLMVALLSAFFLKEKLSNKKTAGLFLGFAGVLVIVVLPALEKEKAFSGNLTGNLLIMLAAIAWAFYTVFSKPMHDKYSTLSINFTMVLTTVIAQSIFAPVEFVRNPTWINHITFVGWFGIIYIGIFGTAIFYVIYQHAIKKASPVTATLTFYLMPIFSFLWAAALLGEKLTSGLVIGALLALFGVYLVTSDNSKDA